MISPMKSLVLIASLGLALGACTVRSDTTVQRPVGPVATTSSTTTTYVQPDSSSSSGTRTTTVYRN